LQHHGRVDVAHRVREGIEVSESERKELRFRRIAFQIVVTAAESATRSSEQRRKYLLFQLFQGSNELFHPVAVVRLPEKPSSIFFLVLDFPSIGPRFNMALSGKLGCLGNLANSLLFTVSRRGRHV
jgi:hypothetical protein